MSREWYTVLGSCHVTCVEWMSVYYSFRKDKQNKFSLQITETKIQKVAKGKTYQTKDTNFAECTDLCKKYEVHISQWQLKTATKRQPRKQFIYEQYMRHRPRCSLFVGVGQSGYTRLERETGTTTETRHRPIASDELIPRVITPVPVTVYTLLGLVLLFVNPFRKQKVKRVSFATQTKWRFNLILIYLAPKKFHTTHFINSVLQIYNYRSDKTRGPLRISSFSVL